MAEQQRTVPIAAEISLLDWVGHPNPTRGNAKSWYAPIGKFDLDDATFRDLLRWAFPWESDIYQLKAAYLDLTGINNVEQGDESSFGANPQIKVRALSGTSPFIAAGGNGIGLTFNDWSGSAATVWPGPGVTGTTVTSAVFTSPAGRQRINVTALVEECMPARVKRRDGTAGGGGTNGNHLGWRVFAQDEADHTTRWTYAAFVEGHTNNPRLTLVFDDNVPPGVPTVITPEPDGNPTVVGSANARTLTVEFVSNIRAGDTTDRVELEDYADGATSDEDPDLTQPVTGTLIATTGAVVPVSTGQLNRYRVTLTGLTPRPSTGPPGEQLYRLRVRNQKGAWGRWTVLESGRIQTAYTPGVPLDPRMTTDPQDPRIAATLNSPNDPHDGVTGITGIFLRHNSDGTTTNLWPNMGTVRVTYVDGTTRAEIGWGGVGLNDGDRVSWRVALLNRDGILSPYTAERTTVMQTATGPTFDPADATEQLFSRTGPVTIDDPVEFDGFKYRLYRNDVLIYTSPTIASGPDVTADITFPAGLLNWGDTFGIEAETRATNTTTFGPTSPRVYLYVDTLPSVGAFTALADRP